MNTTAAQAAELRRIERDLHDGAQARLVALGLALTTAEQAVDRNPDQAKTLLREARTTTTTALRELRDLVRGITPPVLSERGLTDALRALPNSASPTTPTTTVASSPSSPTSTHPETPEPPRLRSQRHHDSQETDQGTNSSSG